MMMMMMMMAVVVVIAMVMVMIIVIRIMVLWWWWLVLFLSYFFINPTLFNPAITCVWLWWWCCEGGSRATSAAERDAAWRRVFTAEVGRGRVGSGQHAVTVATLSYSVHINYNICTVYTSDIHSSLIIAQLLMLEMWNTYCLRVLGYVN